MLSTFKQNLNLTVIALMVATLASACSAGSSGATPSASSAPIAQAKTKTKQITPLAPTAATVAIPSTVNSNVQTKTFNSVPNAQTLDDVQAAAESGSLMCLSPDQCAPALVMVSIATDAGVERCSGFLISENEIMTNDHCIDESIAVKGFETAHSAIPCQNSIFAHLTGSDPTGPGVTVGCESIEYRSIQSGINSVDYAVIKLSEKVTDRTPLKFSARAFQDHEAASVLRVQMTEDGTATGFNGVQSKLSCTASLNTYLYPGVNSSDDALMTFGDCNVELGNSGSPVLNSDGNVGAIMQGYLNAPSDAEVVSELSQIALDKTYGEVAVGSQIFCLKDGFAGTAADCIAVPALGTVMPNDFLAEFADMSLSSLPVNAANHQWKEVAISGTVASSLQKRFADLPNCAASANESVNVTTYQKGLNKLMQVEWRVEDSSGNATLSVDLQAFGISACAP